MASVEKSVLVPFSAEQMFDLVHDVPSYPQFLPWCGGASQVPIEDGKVEATVDIAFKSMKASFTTLNAYERPLHIRMDLKEGPFQTMDGDWTFTALRQDACKIVFRLDYEFSNKVLEQLVGPVFHVITNSFVDSFIERAEALYAAGP